MTKEQLINAQVISKVFGKGVIKSIECSRIVVQFESELQTEKVFAYPSAFDGFLVLDDIALQQMTQMEIQGLKDQEAKESERKRLEQQDRIEREKTKKSNTKKCNIAFKCNYCNGGVEKNGIGYCGVCDDETIRFNICKAKRVWCAAEGSSCRKYLDGKIARNELENMDFVCYESQMLSLWQARAGVVQNGPRKGEPMQLRGVQRGSLCVLTTVDPDRDEDSRYVFALFIVDEQYEGDNVCEGYVKADPQLRISLNWEEAQKLRFWDYYFNPNSPIRPHWGTGLYRHLTDIQSAQILQSLCIVKSGTEDEAKAIEIRDYFFDSNRIDSELLDEPAGCLKR